MYFKSIIILFFTIHLYAIPTVSIDSNHTNRVDFQLEYFVDTSEQLQITDVTNKKFIQDTNKLSLGTDNKYIWLRFTLHNTSKNIQNIYLHQNHAYISNGIEFYALKENTKLIKKSIIDFNHKESTSTMYGTKALFNIKLLPNERQIIYVKNYAIFLPYPYITLHNQEYSKKNLAQSNNLLIVIIGVLLALSLYNFILYLATKYKEYLYYSLYLFSGVIWESIVSGVLAGSFGLYFTNTTNYLFLSVLFIILFLLLFTKTIFNTSKDYKVENYFLNTALSLVVIGIIIGLFDITLASTITTIAYYYTLITILLVTYAMMKKGNKFAGIFLVANSFFAVFVSITDLYYSGFLEYNEYVFSAGSIGISIEAILLSYIISYRFNLQEKALREKDKMIIQQSKMASMGDMIENIAHQWRQPLNAINSIGMQLHIMAEMNTVENSKVIENTQKIEDLIIHMNNTVNDFRNFFKINKKREKTTFKNIMDKALALLIYESTEFKKINITFEEEKRHSIYTYENEVLQVILNIIKNAEEALFENKVLNPYIKIYHYQDEKFSILEIKDNAGGIKDEVINDIFKPYFSTKEKTNGTGIGLYMSKIIIDEHCNGHINVTNDAFGACFQIKLPKHR